MAWFFRFSKLLKHSKNIVFLKKNMIKVWTSVVRCLVIKKFDNKYHLAVICQDRGDNYLPWNAPTSIEYALRSRSFWMVDRGRIGWSVRNLCTPTGICWSQHRETHGKQHLSYLEKSLSGYLVSWWWFFEKKYVLCDGKLKPYWRNQ